MAEQFDYSRLPPVTNKYGGKQSATLGRFDLISGAAMRILAGILQYGADKYGVGNWKKIPVEEHLNHALQHIFAHLEGNTTEDHLGHALCRLVFAVHVQHLGMELDDNSREEIQNRTGPMRTVH